MFIENKIHIKKYESNAINIVLKVNNRFKRIFILCGSIPKLTKTSISDEIKYRQFLYVLYKWMTNSNINDNSTHSSDNQLETELYW